MNATEFATEISWLETAIGKPLAEGQREHDARQTVYFECLGDLSISAFRVAVRRCALERKYQSFPSIAELREFALDSQEGTVKRLSGSDAWGIAMRAVDKCDVDVEGSRERAFLNVPPIVELAVIQFGFMSLYNMPNNAVENARAQFCKLFDSLADTQRKTGLLPAPLRREIAAIANDDVERVAGKLALKFQSEP